MYFIQFSAFKIIWTLFFLSFSFSFSFSPRKYWIKLTLLRSYTQNSCLILHSLDSLPCCVYVCVLHSASIMPCFLQHHLHRRCVHAYVCECVCVCFPLDHFIYLSRLLDISKLLQYWKKSHEEWNECTHETKYVLCIAHGVKVFCFISLLFLHTCACVCVCVNSFNTLFLHLLFSLSV